MTRPRPFIRSLVAATCGTTLLTAAVLGTGGAAFAVDQVPTSDAVVEQVPASEADPEPASDAATPVAEPTSSEGAEPVDPEQPASGAAADEAAAEEPAAKPAPRADAPEADGAPSVVTPAEAPAASTRAAAAEAQVAPLAEEVVTPTLRIVGPGSVPLAGELRPLTIAVDGLTADTPPATVRLTLPADVAEALDVKAFDGNSWQQVDFAFGRRDATVDFPARSEIQLQVGVSQESWEALWNALLLEGFESDLDSLRDGGSLSTLAAPAEEEAAELDRFNLTADLLINDRPVGAPENLAISLVTPKVDLIQRLPGEVTAGKSAKLSYRVTNRTGYDYPANAPITLFQSATILTDEELDLLDELEALWDAGEISDDEFMSALDEIFALQDGELAVACSVNGGASKSVDLTEAYDFVGTGGTLYIGGLKDGETVNVSCDVKVGADVPDAQLLMGAFLTVGKNRAPLYVDDEIGEQLTFIAGAQAPAPTPQPTQPAPAQPAPVRPTPTPSNPPAAAPVRQVPTTALPRTGTDPLPLAAAGLGLVLAGAAALLGGRRRAHN